MTGAAGFIGSHVVSAFAADGHAVTGLDALAPSVPADEPGADDAAAPSDQAASGSDDLIYADVRDIRADLRDAEAVATARGSTSSAIRRRWPGLAMASPTLRSA